MKNLTYAAAAWAAVEQTHFASARIKNQVLSYTACFGAEQSVCVPWTRQIWVTPLCYAQQLLERPIPESAALAAAWLDWAERVPIGGLRGGNPIQAWNRNLCWWTAGLTPLFQISWALRQGYHVVEIRGEGLLVRTPNGRVRAVQQGRCDCLEALGGAECLHIRIEKFYLTHRDFFQRYQNDCKNELVGAAPICRGKEGV